MPRNDRPRLIEDATGRMKLKISLPGGRYQLSLDDSSAVLLRNDMGYDQRDVVPDDVVRVLVATGDAWFPHQQDYQSVIEDLPDTTPIGDADLAELTAYLRSKPVPEARIDTVRNVVRSSPLADRIDPDEIQVKELPSVPSGIFEEETEDAASSETSGESGAEPPEPASPPREKSSVPESIEELTREIAPQTSKSHSYIEARVERLLDAGASPEAVLQTLERQFITDEPDPDVFDIPGVGTIRGYGLITAGLDSVEELAETRPAELAEVSNLDETTATAIVEGARELTGREESTATQLARQTGEPEATFDTAQSLLAAAGVPPSASVSTLRELCGPSLVEIDSVDARMAYFLYESGYTTPWEVVQASLAELEEVDYLGPSTAERVQADARELLQP